MVLISKPLQQIRYIPLSLDINIKHILAFIYCPNQKFTFLLVEIAYLNVKYPRLALNLDQWLLIYSLLDSHATPKALPMHSLLRHSIILHCSSCTSKSMWWYFSSMIIISVQQTCIFFISCSWLIQLVKLVVVAHAFTSHSLTWLYSAFTSLLYI